jgi:hypothetical protein
VASTTSSHRASSSTTSSTGGACVSHLQACDPGDPNARGNGESCANPFAHGLLGPRLPELQRLLRALRHRPLQRGGRANQCKTCYLRPDCYCTADSDCVRARATTTPARAVRRENPARRPRTAAAPVQPAPRRLVRRGLRLELFSRRAQVHQARTARLTPAEIMALEPTSAHATKRQQLDDTIVNLEALRANTRRNESSIPVPSARSGRTATKRSRSSRSPRCGRSARSFRGTLIPSPLRDARRALR